MNKSSHRSHGPSMPRDFSSRPKRNQSQVNGGGRRADPHEIQRLLHPQRSRISHTFDGVTYGVNGFGNETVQLLHNRPFHLAADIRQQNTLIIGQDREVIEQHVFLPLLFSSVEDRRTSAVLFVPPGDIYSDIQAISSRCRPDRRVDRINFYDRRSSTQSWSVVENVDPNHPFEVLDEVKSFVTAVRDHDQGIGDFFLTPICQLTAALLCRFQETFGNSSLADVFHAIHLPQEQLENFLKAGSPNPLVNSLVQVFESGDYNTETFLEEARTALHAFHDKDIASVTATTSLDTRTLLVQPRILVVEVPQAGRQLVMPLISAFVEKLLRPGSKSLGSHQLHRSCHLSLYFDCSLLARGNQRSSPPLSLDLLRATGADVVAMASSVGSVASLFGTDADVLLEQFGTKILQSPVEMNDANWASFLTGETTIESTSRGDQPLIRPVIESEQIHLSPRLPRMGRAATVFLPDIRPFQVWFPRKSMLLASELATRSMRTLHPPNRHGFVIPTWSPLLDKSDTEGSELVGK